MLASSGDKRPPCGVPPEIGEQPALGVESRGLEDATDVAPVFGREPRQQFVVVDVVEESLNIPFNDPRRRVPTRQQREALRDGVPGGALRTKAVGVGLKLQVPFRFHGEFMQGLPNAILNGWDTQGPELAVFSWE